VSADKPIAPIRYNSFYPRGVDEKRRIQVPAKWRPSGGGVEFTIIVWPDEPAGIYLRVIPPEGMAKLDEILGEILRKDPRKGVLKRVIGKNSEQVALDRAGRICLPDSMAQAAGIKDEAVLVGCIDHFQIWNPERYKNVQVSDEVLAAEAFKLIP